MPNAPDIAGELRSAFESGRARVGVVGLGYVGLPLVRVFHDAGFEVVGFDIDPAKIEALRAGRTYLKHLGESLATELSRSPRFVASSEPAELGSCHAILVCVPTPLGPHQEPDLSYLESSSAMVGRALRAGALVVIVSTSYPGTTREACLPALEASGRRLGRDLFVCFSPEREDPGRRDWTTKSTPRLVGGLDAASTRLGMALFSRAVDRVVEVESAEVAEAAKLLENIYRAVNIALVNELKPVLSAMGLDIWQVIEAASTKPYGFAPFHPGPGLGGHCIPIDPFYLAWRARRFGQRTRFIELAGEINSGMPERVVEAAGRALSDAGKPLRGARVLVLGLAYKPDVDDVRETPAAEVIRLLAERGAVVSYHDPHVARFPAMRRYRFDLESKPLTADVLSAHDCVLIITNHRAIDWPLVAREARLVVDTRNALAGLGNVRARVFRA